MIFVLWHFSRKTLGKHLRLIWKKSSNGCKLSLFEELGLLGNTLILIASLLALDKASDLTINNSVKVAGTTGFSKTTTGFILIAFCTSLPALWELRS
jgi:hypothetical protein